jgi:lipopolysaccharide export system permease protein
LRTRGIDPKSYEVDLEMKIATNFLPLVMGIIGIPFALKHPRMGSVAASFSLSLAIGFSFWVVQAVGISLARGGAMLPVVAAWLPHVIFFLIGLYSFLGVEER